VRGGVADEIIGIVRHAIDENRDTAVMMAQENSRWWIASPVDRRVADLVVNAVLSMLDDLRQNARLRQEFEAGFDGMVEALEKEGVLTRAVSDARSVLVRSARSTKRSAASPANCATALARGSPLPRKRSAGGSRT
jgi:hypothetical protein